MAELLADTRAHFKLQKIFIFTYTAQWIMWKKTKWQSQKQQSLTSRHRCGSKTWTLPLPTGRRRSPVCSWRKEDTFATPLIPRGQRKLIFPQVHPQELTLASTHTASASAETIVGLILLPLQLTTVPSLWICTWWFFPYWKGGGLFPAPRTHPLPLPHMTFLSQIISKGTVIKVGPSFQMDRNGGCVFG